MKSSGGGGLRVAPVSLLPETGSMEIERIGARLLSLLGPERLDAVQHILDNLRGASSTDPVRMLQRIHQLLTERVPEVGAVLRSRDLVDHQHQDVPLALLFLTHPALPAQSAPLLLLRLLQGWYPWEIASRLGWSLERIESRLLAGYRRIQVIRLQVEWPRRRELAERVEHALGVLAGLPNAARRNRPGTQLEAELHQMTMRLTETLRSHPVTGGRAADSFYWQARFREVHRLTDRAAG